MSRLPVAAAVVIVMTGCPRSEASRVAARVGTRSISWSQVEDRAALSGKPSCAALDDLVEEELLAVDVCGRYPTEAACRRADRTSAIALAVADLRAPPTPEEVEDVSHETPFLDERSQVDPGLAQALATHRLARRLLSERAAEQARRVRVVVSEDCRVGRRPDARK